MGARRAGFDLGMGERSAVWLVARAEARRRWGTLAGVAILTALVGGAVLMALTGAERTASTIDRFRTQARASDVSYQAATPEQVDAIAQAVAAQPDVERSTRRVLVNGWPDEPSIPDIGILSDPSGVWGDELDRPRLLAGRFPHPDAPDEVLLSSTAAEEIGAKVGDVVPVNTWTTDDLEQLFAGSTFPGFNGPRLDLRVVGLGRFPEELSGDLRRGELTALASPGFVAAHEGIGAWPGVVIARLRHGAQDVAQVTDGAEAALPPDDLAASGGALLTPVTATDLYLDTAQGAVDSLAVGLLVLAAGAATAGAVALGQAISRQTTVPAASARALAGMGATPGGIALGTSLPVVGAAIVGLVLGGIGATAASPALPTGLARRAEVSPGVWVSPAVLFGGGLVLVVAVSWWAFRSARRSLSRPGAGVAAGPRRPSAVARAASRFGLPLAGLIGVYLAGDRGRGAGSVPLRSAVLGVAVGVGGLVGAGVIATSLHDLSTEPARWGWNWSTIPDYFGDADLQQLETELVADPRLDAVAHLISSNLLVNGENVTVYSVDAAKGDLSLTLLEGQLPDQPDEVALGEQTMGDLGVEVGEPVELLTEDGATHELAVVGVALLPPVEERSIGLGAVMTPGGLADMSVDEPLESVVVRYAPGLPVEEVEAGLTADHDLDLTPFSRPLVPGPIRNLAASRYVAVSLAIFFGALGAIALLHALLVSARRRRGDLALVRALGGRPAQVRRGVVTESLLLCGEALVIGIPAGLVVGRLLWRLLVQHVRALAEPVMPWPLLVALVPVAALAAVALAWWPSRLAARGRPAAHLRAD